MRKKSVLIVMLLIGSYLPGFSADTLRARIEQAVVQAQQAPLVNVKATLVKPVYMSELMFRPPHDKDQVVSYKKKTTECQGVLSELDRRIYVPTACISTKDYKLFQVILTFGNGRVITNHASSVMVTDEISFISLATQSLTL